MASEDLMTRALGGDDDAIEELVGAIEAPVFDLALHWTNDLERATEAAAQALGTVVASLLDGDEPKPSAITMAVAHLIADTPATPDSSAPWAKLSDEDRTALLVAMATDLDGTSLGHVLGVSAEDGAIRVARAQDALDLNGCEVRDEMDERAATHSLPMDLTERALEAGGITWED